MPDRLLLRLQSGGDATWLRQAADGRVASPSTRGLPPASALAGDAEIVVLVPAEHVLLTEAKVAARTRTQLLQALPFAIEDQLLAPVEDLHFAASAEVGETVGVAVVARTALRAWLDRLAESGIQPDVLLPESLALPIAPATASALIEDAHAVVRLAPWSAFSC
ncbi:MAG: type II secretion system protein GspL, partial [Rhodanobacteraceae bacterium]